MFPDNVETITMTKDDYDRNVEQLLLEKLKLEQKCEELEKENARLKAFEEKINFEELLKRKGEYYLSMVESQRSRE